MKLVVFGLSLSSSWGNGHATTWRALLGAFAERGHDVTFYEWDAPWYGGANRDLPEPGFCRLVLYPAWDEVRERALAEARDADAVMVGSYVKDGPRLIDDLLEAGVGPSFYDIDTPVTVAALRAGTCPYLRPDQVPLLRPYLSFTGGPFLRDVLEAELGARDARALYCSVDLERYDRSAPDPRFAADLAYMGTYAPDRQPGLHRLLLVPARRRPERRFLVAGPQYPDVDAWPTNVRRMEHVAPADHPAFYSTAAWQLNLTRAAMRRAGWSPSVRLFEAAACGAALVSDRWVGLEELFRPGHEIVLAESTEALLEVLEGTHEDDRRALGEAARARVREDHSARKRAQELEELLAGAPARPRAPAMEEEAASA